MNLSPFSWFLWFPADSHVQSPQHLRHVLISFLLAVVPSVLRTVSLRIISCLVWLRCSAEEIIPALLWFYYPHIHKLMCTWQRRLNFHRRVKLINCPLLLMYKGFNQGPWITGKQSVAESKHHSNRFWLDFAPPHPCLVWLSPHLSLMYVCALLFGRTILTAGYKGQRTPLVQQKV